MRRRLVIGIVTALAWLLITPPDRSTPPWTDGVDCGGPGHSNPCMPLVLWDVLGRFDDLPACNRARDDGIVATQDDVVLARWQLARCFSAERVRNGPRLQPGE